MIYGVKHFNDAQSAKLQAVNDCTSQTQQKLWGLDE